MDQHAAWRRGAFAAAIAVSFVTPAALAAPGDALDAPFLVPVTPYLDLNPAVARNLTTGNFVVAWQSFTGTKGYNVVHARQFRADGTPMGGDIAVNLAQQGYSGNPAVAMDDNGDFVVAWTKGADVWARRYSAAGVGGLPLLIGGGSDGVGAPSVAMDGDGDFVVGWLEASGLHPKVGTVISCYYAQAPCIHIDADSASIRTRRYNANGLPLGAEAVVDSSQSVSLTSASNGHVSSFTLTEPVNLGQTARVAMAADGSYVVAWSRQPIGASGYQTVTRHYSRYNIATEQPQLVRQGDGGALNPAIAMAPSGSYVLAYDTGYGGGIYVQPYTAAGAKLGPTLRADDGSFAYPRAPVLTMDKAGDFVVSWDQSWDYTLASYQLPARYYGVGGVAHAIIQLAPAGTKPGTPALASDGAGNFVAAWFDIAGDNAYSVTARLFSGH